MTFDISFLVTPIEIAHIKKNLKVEVFLCYFLKNKKNKKMEPPNGLDQDPWAMDPCPFHTKKRLLLPAVKEADCPTAGPIL